MCYYRRTCDEFEYRTDEAIEADRERTEARRAALRAAAVAAFPGAWDVVDDDRDSTEDDIVRGTLETWDPETDGPRPTVEAVRAYARAVRLYAEECES